MTISDKNKDIISSIREASKNKGKIVFIHGIFNIIHPGHLRLFRFAKEYSDFWLLPYPRIKISRCNVKG